MRLLHTSTLKFHEFYGQVPNYAILSHTWQDEEVTFQEMLNRDSSVQEKAGYAKILHFCQIAVRSGFKYGWVDTCCIDKTNLTELSEAINSMFRWYKDASELLAPAKIDFYDARWQFITTKLESIQHLSGTTGIAISALSEANFQTFSVAARMSWAAKRMTTRMEDTAYCLMGIFDVNMPLLYGEGGKAFMRLQEEIARGTGDQLVFAWDAGHGNLDDTWTSVFSPSPAFFSSRVKRMIELDDVRNNFSYQRMPYTITNTGLRITLPIVRSGELGAYHRRYAVLDCHVGGGPVCIQLERQHRYSGNRYRRLPGHMTTTLDMLEGRNCTVEEVYITTKRFEREADYSVETFRNLNTGLWSTQKLEIHRSWRSMELMLLTLDTIDGDNRAWMISDVVAFAHIACFGFWPLKDQILHYIPASYCQWSRGKLIDNMWPVTFMLFNFALDRRYLILLAVMITGFLNLYRTLWDVVLGWLARKLSPYNDRASSVSTLAEELMYPSDRVREYTSRWRSKSSLGIPSKLKFAAQIAVFVLKPFLLLTAFNIFQTLFAALSNALQHVGITR